MKSKNTNLFVYIKHCPSGNLMVSILNNSQMIFPFLHKPLYSHQRIWRNILTPCPLRTVQNVSSNSGKLHVSTLCKHWPSHQHQCGISTRSFEFDTCYGILRYSIDLLLRVLNWYNLMIQINKKGTSLIIMF